MAGKRGRPRKSPTVEELVKLVEPELIEAVKNIPEVETSPIKTLNNTILWDVKREDTIDYFDSTLSYELTGYRPIDEERGLDFKPEWFTEAKTIKLNTGKYCAYPPGTKKYVDFWTEQVRRCNEGYTSHGYRITGDNYFFLNFYRLKDTLVEVAGRGRLTGFPQFFSKQYEYFHYIEICEHLKKDVCALKARGVGQH